MWADMGATEPSGATGVATPLAELRGAEYMKLTTFRKSGVGVPTPVWFAQAGATLYITTTAQAGKVKRIRANPHVLIAPCDARGVASGPDREAQARVLAPEEFARATEALRAKYGFRYSLIRLFGRVARRRQSESVFLAVTPSA